MMISLPTEKGSPEKKPLTFDHIFSYSSSNNDSVKNHPTEKKHAQEDEDESGNKNKKLKDATSVKALDNILEDTKNKTDQGVDSVMVNKSSPSKDRSQKVEVLKFVAKRARATEEKSAKIKSTKEVKK